MNRRTSQVTREAAESERRSMMDTALAEWNAMAGDSGIADSAIGLLEPPHQLESAVRRELLQNDRLRFSTLVVRRLRNGVCLEGVVEMDENGPDLAKLVMSIDGVDRVDNRLVVRRPLPRKK